MEVLHWDKVPEDAAISVSEFREDPFKKKWGIKARLADGREFWILMSDPPDLVVVPNPAMCQTILTNLKSLSRMKKSVEDRGEWEEGDSPELPDYQSFPLVQWKEVQDSALFHELEFRGEPSNVWGIIALLPDGEHLVMFDRLAEDAGYHTFSRSREEAQHTIFFLELRQTPPDPEIEVAEESPEQPALPPAAVPASIPAEILGVSAEELERGFEEIDYIAMGWFSRLRHGKHVTCICRSCRDWYRYRLEAIAGWYRWRYGDVPTEIRMAANLVIRSWEVFEKNNRQA